MINLVGNIQLKYPLEYCFLQVLSAKITCKNNDDGQPIHMFSEIQVLSETNKIRQIAVFRCPDAHVAIVFTCYTFFVTEKSF